MQLRTLAESFSNIALLRTKNLPEQQVGFLFSLLHYCKSTSSTPGYFFLSKVNCVSAMAALVFMVLTVYV